MLFDPKKFKQYSPPAKESDVVEGLKIAKTIIENGWCQKVGRHGHEVCLQTAIYDVFEWSSLLKPWSSLFTVDYCILGARARGVIHEAIKCLDIVAWNDEPSRTKQQVIDAVDKAIGIARLKNL